MSSPESKSWVTQAFEQDGYDVAPALNMPESWKLADPENLTNKDKANIATLNLAADIHPALNHLVEIGFGKKITGSVEGREEDDAIEIDDLAEDLIIESLKNSSERFGLNYALYTEHKETEDTPVEIGNSNELVDVSLDPLDNSDEHHRGLDTPAHSVFSIYDPETNDHLSAIDINLSNGTMMINRDGKNYSYNPRTNDLTEIHPPEKIEDIDKRELTIASYFGRRKYSNSFDGFFEELRNKDRHEKSTFHGKGGAHIYSSLAKGAVSAYVMLNEPRGEIDPGFGFAKDAGCIVWSVDPETGEATDYTFDPEENKNKGSVPFFIAANSGELGHRIIREFMEKKQEMTEEQYNELMAA